MVIGNKGMAAPPWSLRGIPPWPLVLGQLLPRTPLPWPLPALRPGGPLKALGTMGVWEARRGPMQWAWMGEQRQAVCGSPLRQPREMQ